MPEPKVVTFKCTHRQKPATRDYAVEGTEKGQRRTVTLDLHEMLANNLRLGMSFNQLQQALQDKFRVKRSDGVWKRLWQTEMHQEPLMKIRTNIWQYSKTGEVNSTNFKQDEKSSVARFLAKMVEGEIPESS